MPLGRFRMIGFLNANQQGSRLSTGSIALVRWLAEFAPKSATMEDPRCCNGASAVVGSVGYLKLEIDRGARAFGCIEMSELRLMLLEKRGTFRVIV